jgi:hypothetical protein
MLKEELIESVVSYSGKKPIVTTPYLKFMIEAPHLIDDKHYLQVLTVPIKREFYEVNQLELPYVPNYTMIKMKAYIKGLKSAKLVF